MDCNISFSGTTQKEIPYLVLSHSLYNSSFYCLRRWQRGFSSFRFGLCKKRSFSLGGSGAAIKDNTNCISISSISELGIKTYENPKESRELIRKDNNGKIGVYCWFNNINGRYYIGSGNPLYSRLSDYYQDWYYLSRASTYIVRALSKYGMDNFSLVILEYTTSDDLILCEQKWMDLLKPVYNLNP
uniref:GIY-YIG endonuclease n=1 Tax=Chrysoporthe austroafricana TaxID=354353 RepID=A0A191MWQ9_9PEZI|nr:GIY-YIG endonuclease [Chrysoporthe austroafricana]AMX22092.1 GIY-YIG endonuclease [Chrysoporthe austroafricana]